MPPDISIYQPFYKPGLLERLDRGFVALDWMANPEPAKRELALHEHILNSRLYEQSRLTGVLSPKFFAKTNLHSAQVYEWISCNPGYDIYLISGTPFVPYANWNTIERNNGQTRTFEIRMRSLCRQIGLPLSEPFGRQTNANCCSCNYWIASPGFWERWGRDVVRPLGELSRGEDSLFASANYAAPASPVYLLTLIYERLIDHYISHYGIKALYYPWAAESILTLTYHPSIKKYLDEMVPLVDAIDARGLWTEPEKAWLRERYAAVSLGFAPAETLSADETDHDLPRRSPNARGSAIERLNRDRLDTAPA